jgi:hypothetical protein
MTVPALLERLSLRKAKASPPPATPQPPEDINAARAFLGLCRSYEAARRAHALAVGDHEAASGALANAELWLEEVNRRDHDFIFKNPEDFYDDKASSGRRVRLEVVREQAEAAVERTRQSLDVATNALTVAEIVLGRSLAAVVDALGDGAVPAERLLEFRAFESERGLIEAEAAHATARRVLDEACTAASAVPSPRTLQVIFASGRRPRTPAVVGAEESLAAAEESRRHAAREIDRVQEETTLFRHALAAVVEADRAAEEQENSRPRRRAVR